MRLRNTNGTWLYFFSHGALLPVWMGPQKNNPQKMAGDTTWQIKTENMAFSSFFFLRGCSQLCDKKKKNDSKKEENNFQAKEQLLAKKETARGNHKKYFRVFFCLSPTLWNHLKLRFLTTHCVHKANMRQHELINFFNHKNTETRRTIHHRRGRLNKTPP